MTQLKTNNDITISNNRLSVQVSLTGLSFLITDQESKELLFFAEEEFSTSRTPEELLIELEKAFSKYSSLQEKFDEIRVVYATNIYSIVPNALFDETKASDYLKFNSKLLESDYIAHDTIENYEMVVVYVPFININNYIFDRFGSFQYFHASSLLLKYVLDTEKNCQDDKVYIHAFRTTFDLVIMKSGTLQLCNTYTYNTPEDFIYYILFGFEQLGLNPEITETVLCGAISENDETYKVAYQFIRNISLKKPVAPSGDIGLEDSAISTFILLNSL